MADNTQAIDREVVETYETGFPKHEPTRTRKRGGKTGSNQSAGSEKVTVQGATSKPTNAKKQTVPKIAPKDLQDLTVGGLSVAGFFMRPGQMPDGTPIWPIDKSDPGDVQALKQLGESGAALINRLPDWLRKYIVSGVKGGAIGVEMTQFYEALMMLVGSRLMMMQMAAQDAANAKRGRAGMAYQDQAVDPIPDSQTMAEAMANHYGAGGGVHGN